MEKPDLPAIPVPPLSARICAAFGLDPLATIASGALLLATAPEDVAAIRNALVAAGIACAVIGHVESGPAVVLQETKQGRQALPRPDQDEIARVYET